MTDQEIMKQAYLVLSMIRTEWDKTGFIDNNDVSEPLYSAMIKTIDAMRQVAARDCWNGIPKPVEGCEICEFCGDTTGYYATVAGNSPGCLGDLMCMNCATSTYEQI